MANETDTTQEDASALLSGRQELYAKLVTLHGEVREAFLRERAAELPEEQRPSAEETEALSARLQAEWNKVLALWLKAPEPNPFQAMPAKSELTHQKRVAAGEATLTYRNALRALPESERARPSPDLEAKLERADRLTFEAHLAALWERVWPEWQHERRQLPPGLYRYPVTVLAPYHRAIGGKRHGKAHGLGIRVEGSPATRDVRLVVEAPKGVNIELGHKALARSSPEDLDTDGQLRDDAVMRLVREVTGPQVAMIGHVAFALAQKQANEEGRPADGRFWFSPSEVADLLGYSRESNGKASASRIGRDATKTVRKNFLFYADTSISQTVTLPDGTRHTIRGTLLYPTQKEHTQRAAGGQQDAARRPGQRGRDKRVEYRIRDELWALTAGNHVRIPLELLDSKEQRPDTWAHCIRLYEVLASHGKINPGRAGAGEPLPLSLEVLARESNMFGPDVPTRKEHGRLLDYLERLKQRGAVTFERATLSDGRPGIRFLLPEPRRAELAAVAARRRALTAKTPRRTRRSPSARNGGERDRP